MGFRVLVSLHPAIQATGRLTLAPAGLPPAEHTSLHWTHNRTCRSPASGLYGAVFVKGSITRFLLSFVMSFHSFVRPAPRAFFRPDGMFPSPSRAAAVKDSVSSAPPDASTAAGCRRSVIGRAMIRGEPAIGRDQSANHACIRLNPYGVPTMKQSYASAGKAPRRRVHSLSGIAAIAGCGLPPPRIVIGYPAHQAQSGAEPCCPLSF